MREIRLSGSEGGETQANESSLPLSARSKPITIFRSPTRSDKLKECFCGVARFIDHSLRN